MFRGRVVEKLFAKDFGFWVGELDIYNSMSQQFN